MLNLTKQLIYNYILTPLESRGIQFTMRRKLLPKNIVKDIQECRKKSYCSFIHFDCVYKSLQYLNENNIEGDIVLCGVAKGGLAKFMLNHMGYRLLWLYDTFDGGSVPGCFDSPEDRERYSIVKKKTSTDVEEVIAYLNDYLINLIVGDVLKTIPSQSPDKIALLYLDTDWFASTYHEMLHLEPKVEKGGIIIQDDMGLCRGARDAVNEYYETYNGISPKPFFIPMDEGGCIWQKL